MLKFHVVGNHMSRLNYFKRAIYSCGKCFLNVLHNYESAEFLKWNIPLGDWITVIPVLRGHSKIGKAKCHVVA